MLPQATYCYIIVPLVDDLKSPYYLVDGHDLLERRLSNKHSYCRFIGNQPGILTVQELWKLWKFHATPSRNRMAETSN